MFTDLIKVYKFEETIVVRFSSNLGCRDLNPSSAEYEMVSLVESV